MQREALKEATGAKGNAAHEENIIRGDPRRRGTTPHLHCDFVPLTKGGIYRRKTQTRQKKMRRTRYVLKQCSSAVPALNSASFGAGEKLII